MFQIGIERRMQAYLVVDIDTTTNKCNNNEQTCNRKQNHSDYATLRNPNRNQTVTIRTFG